MDVNDIAYQAGQAAVAVGAFFLTVFLYRTRLVPRFLARWGTIGYVLHFTGATAELFGAHISMFLLIPGGLFELTFALWLLVRGLTSGTNSAHRSAPGSVKVSARRCWMPGIIAARTDGSTCGRASCTLRHEGLSLEVAALMSSGSGTRLSFRSRPSNVRMSAAL